MTKVKAIETTDGQIFKDIGAAQKHEIVILLGDSIGDSAVDSDKRMNFAHWAVENGPALINILTMKPSSHPAARKANGATRKPRTVKPVAPTKPEAT